MQAVKFGHDFRLATKSRCWCSKNMSESSAKNKKTKSKKVKLIAKRPGKIVAAVKTWVKSAEKSACEKNSQKRNPSLRIYKHFLKCLAFLLDIIISIISSLEIQP